ncbi:MAG: VC0807 family protein [Chloroflexota bacterium]
MASVAPGAAPAPSFRRTLGGLLPSIVISGVFPYVIYHVLKHSTTASDLLALAVSAIPAILYGLFGILRQRRLDLIAAVTLVGIAVTIGAALLGGDPRLFLLRESMLTVVLGLACLVSLVFPKPLWFYIIRYFASANDPARAEAFSANWRYPGFRTFTRVLTLVWGLTYLGEFVLRVILVYHMSIAQFLALSPFIFYGITIAVIAFTFAYSNRARRLGEARRQELAGTAQAQAAVGDETGG